MHKKAIIDIDNTLWHFCDALYEELQKINENFPGPDSWTRQVGVGFNEVFDV